MNDFDSRSFTSKPLLGTSDVATRLGMSREQVWRLFASGRLPGYRFDRHVRFSQHDVEAFKDAHYRTSTLPTIVKATEDSQGRSNPTDASEYQPI